MKKLGYKGAKGPDGKGGFGNQGQKRGHSKPANQKAVNKDPQPQLKKLAKKLFGQKSSRNISSLGHYAQGSNY